MATYRWHCPFCGQHATIKDDNYTKKASHFDNHNKYGMRAVSWLAVTCPNEQCGEFAFRAWIGSALTDKYGNFSDAGGEIQHAWQLVPAADMKVMPDYLPDPIKEDYREACLIADLSPKASATLSRRALQGMIRDYWGVSKPNLYLEIEAIKDKVDELAWEAIAAVRKIGNVGAHMEKDINVIVDVEPEEAKLLIGLIETLVDDWYVARHQKQSRMTKLVDKVKSKFAPKVDG